MDARQQIEFRAQGSGSTSRTMPGRRARNTQPRTGEFSDTKRRTRACRRRLAVHGHAHRGGTTRRSRTAQVALASTHPINPRTSSCRLACSPRSPASESRTHSAISCTPSSSRLARFVAEQRRAPSIYRRSNGECRPLRALPRNCGCSSGLPIASASMPRLSQSYRHFRCLR